MQLKLHKWFFIIVYFLSCNIYSQDISLYKQYNGRYDFLFIGNTLNSIENNNIKGLPEPPCVMLPYSSALLNLSPSDIIENAYLYWAGSGTGDFEVQLNDEKINAERKFSIYSHNGYPFFSAFTNITSFIKLNGNRNYTFSNLDISDIISYYCPFGGNFGGWAIVIVYKNDSLPLNQLNIYDGLQSVPDKISVTLNSLNVIDNQDAKIGFVAWEGDKNIAEGESLFINGKLIDNPPLNPGNNAFNGTNSFLDTDNLYNMDLDVYNIQNNIKIGDSQVTVELTSDRDFVMVNAIVTKLNSQLPDATINIDNINLKCDSNKINVTYTVSNLNSTNPLPANTSIAIYANDTFINKVKTLNSIPINGTETNIISISIPDTFTSPFELKFAIDDDGQGKGFVNELNENNNTSSEIVSMLVSDKLKIVENLVSCNLGLGKGIFNFSDYEELIKVNPTDKVNFYESEKDMNNNVNIIYNTTNYNTDKNLKTIFIKVNNENCSSSTSFDLIAKNCPPRVHNFISANNDGVNNTFKIEGLRDVFLNFKLSIYNRWGTLIWNGDSHTPDWDGHANNGLLIDNSKIPDGTYFYVLDLNDPNYTKPIAGYLFLTN